MSATVTDAAFRSSTNDVSAIRFGRHAAVRKVYREVTKVGSLAYPIERFRIEANMLRVLRRLFADLLEVPPLLGSGDDPPHNVISLLNGSPLRDLRPESWPSPDRFLSLGMCLARAARTSEGMTAALFSGLEEVQSACGRVLSDYKGVPVAFADAPPSLSIGDVGIQNILCVESGLGLIDFEFAHRASVGKDAGIFIAELKAHEQIWGLSPAYREHLLDGYCSEGADPAPAERWAERALPYHYDKQHKYRFGRGE